MEEKIRAVLVDDDSTCMLMLENLLAGHFPMVQILGKADCVSNAIPLINETQPDLVFLDINLPDGEGFDVISKVSFKDFQVTFITAYDKYAVRAFECSALYYIVKPVTYEGLKTAIDKYNRESKSDFNTKLNVLRETLKSKNEKIIISSSDGLNIVKLGDIIRLEADDVYTLFYMANGQRFIASKPLNNYERILEDLPFSRIHNKHLINLMYIKRYIKGKGGSVIMEDNSEVEVSVRKKADFLDKLKNYARFA